ncbi:MAG: hypothetical protein Kow0065_19640 [Methylomicrobium sp.]
MLLSFEGVADNLERDLQAIESEWASIYYASANSDKESAYAELFKKVKALSQDKPDSAELVFWQGTIIASKAEHQNGIEALAAIHKARDLLAKAVELKPDVLEGSALITLGTLYFLAPPWPIAFGDNQQAEKLLKRGLEVNPASIEGNYYYAQLLLSHEQTETAIEYFQRALEAPVRKEQEFADSRLKVEVMKKFNEIAKLDQLTKKGLLASNQDATTTAPRQN